MTQNQSPVGKTRRGLPPLIRQGNQKKRLSPKADNNAAPMLINEQDETVKQSFHLSLSKENLNDDKRQVTPLSGK